MKRILVAIDLRAEADRAFDRGVQLAQEHDAELILAHVVSRRRWERDNEALNQAEQALRLYCPPAGVMTRHIISRGSPAPEIAALVGSVQADLLVLGLHHGRPFMDFFTDTVGHVVARRCNIPVLVSKDRTAGPYKRVLATTDFSICAKRALHAALDLALTAEFHLLHVFQTPFPAFVKFREDELDQFQAERLAQIRRDIDNEMSQFVVRGAARPSPRITPMVECNEVDAGIAKAVASVNPDLLVMGLNGSNFAALVGSRTQAYLNAPTCDVMVTP